MAQLYTTGFMGCWVGTPGTQTGGNFLGTFEEPPTIEDKAEYVPVKNDIAGPIVPMDKLYAGSHAMASGKLNRFNWGVYQAIANKALPGSPAGFDSAVSRGTLMLTEGACFPVWFSFPFGAGGQTPVPAMATLPAGYHFWGGFLEGPERIQGGVRPLSVSVVFTFLAIFNVGALSFTLYDNNMAGLGPVN